MSVIHGSGGGGTQISAVQNGNVVGTSFRDLGYQEGAVFLADCVKEHTITIQEAVEKWGRTIETKVEQWFMKSVGKHHDVEDQLCEGFLKIISKEKTVIGISAVYYAMSDTIESHNVSHKNPIKKEKMLEALDGKLVRLLKYPYVESAGEYKTDFETFDKKSFFRQIAGELANVKLQRIYVDVLYG